MGSDGPDGVSAHAGQGIFTLEEHAHSWPLHLLAQNIEADSVLLEWPSLEEFEPELREPDFDYVCISFMNRDLDKLPLMSDAVRRIWPKAKIVIGGYGVICLPDPEAAKRARPRLHLPHRRRSLPAHPAGRAGGPADPVPPAAIGGFLALAGPSGRAARWAPRGAAGLHPDAAPSA